MLLEFLLWEAQNDVADFRLALQKPLMNSQEAPELEHLVDVARVLDHAKIALLTGTLLDGVSQPTLP